MLTKDEILAMKPGRELDELVMIKVMGWTKEAEHKPLPMWRDNNGFNVDRVARFFNPSEDISAAWEIVKILREKGWATTLRIDNIVWCKLYGLGLGYFTCLAKTAPEAICKAALICTLDGER